MTSIARFVGHFCEPRKLSGLTDALQLFHRFANIVERYIVCEMRSADPRRHNESNFSVLEFFIELQRVEDFFARETFRQRRGQLELPEKIDNCIALIGRQASPSDGNGARGDNSETQRFAVKKLAIISCAFDGVANRVTEIKKSALASPVAFVFRDDPRFDLDVALDQWL